MLENTGTKWSGKDKLWARFSYENGMEIKDIAMRLKRTPLAIECQLGLNADVSALEPKNQHEGVSLTGLQELPPTEPKLKTGAQIRPWSKEENEAIVTELYHGLTIKEISELHGRSVDHIKSQLIWNGVTDLEVNDKPKIEENKMSTQRVYQESIAIDGLALCDCQDEEFTEAIEKLNKQIEALVKTSMGAGEASTKIKTEIERLKEDRTKVIKLYDNL